MKDHGSPLYALDRETLIAKGRNFLSAFEECHSAIQPFYAVKSNNHPEVARTLVDLGYGLDVSSGLELEMALECGAKEIIFSGPGKVDDEIDLAVKYSDRVTLLLDSFAELVGSLKSHQRVTVLALDHRTGNTGYLQVVVQ